MRLLVLAIALAACGGGAPRGSPPAPSCSFTRSELKSKSSCLGRRVNADPDATAAALSAMKVSGADEELLLELPVDGAKWISVAQSAKDRGAPDVPLALVLMKVANKKAKGDASVEHAAATFTHDLAKQANREDLAKTARAKLIGLAQAEPRLRLATIESFTAAGDEGAVGDICKRGIDVSTAWACAKGSPSRLSLYVPVLADLPVLGADDAKTLRALDKDGKLDGLTCLDAPPKPEPGRLTEGSTRMPEPAELKLYYRLHRVVPTAQGTCLLERVAAYCFGQLRTGKTCSVPYALADYMRRLDEEGKNAMISVFFGSKRTLYGELKNQPKAGYALFHLHLLLADVLFGRKTGDFIKTSAYHVERAYMFRANVDAKINFKDLLSPQLVKALCEQPAQPHLPRPACAGQCTSASCTRSCEEAVRNIAPAICTK